MSKDRKNIVLPQRCYAVLPYDGRLVTITQGTPGYTPSPLDQGDQQINRAIADKENKALGGVTPEQETAMITGAIFGWEFATMMAGSPAKPGRIFELEISRPGSFGANTAATLTLPATPYELADALDKARITDDRVIYSIEILDCKLDYLPQFLGTGVNIHELNHLAQRLAALSEWDMDCFEGMVMMDTVRTQYAPIAVERLINMTHSTADCQIVYEAHDNESLGKFYAENGFVPELETLPEKIFPWLDYGKIGKELHDGEGGVFTPSGYVVLNGEIAQAYQSGAAIPAQKPDYTVLLKVTKGYFNDPKYDNDLITFLKLPAGDNELYRAVAEVDAASPKECGFTAVDCIVPRLTEKINDTLDVGVGDCHSLMNALAKQLQQLDRTGNIPIYKAMLEAAKDISLEETLDISYHTDGFSLMREAASPADYAAKEIQRLMSYEHDEGLEKYFDLPGYGRFIMEKNGIMETSYGFLDPEGGQTVEQCLSRPDRNMEMR